MARLSKADQQSSIDQLTSEDGYAIKPGDTIYTSNHGSTGTYLKCFVVKSDKQGEYVPFNITWHVAHALGIKPTDKQGEWMIHNPVYGMDRGFDLVYNLSRKLFPDSTHKSDSGYALNHRWL